MTAFGTIEDLETGKFEQNDIWLVCMKFDEATLDPLTQPEWSIEDLEKNKFTDDGKVRTIFTM